MLSPEYLDQAGEKVASVYRQIEAEMLEYLARRMLEGSIADQRSLTALELLAQSAAAPLMEIVGRHEADISAAVKLEVSDAIKRCSADDLRRIKQGLGLDMAAATTRQTALTVGGVARILERDNIDMAEGARDAFLQQSIWAVTQVNTGAMTTERALHMAVRRLERSGISVVQYRNAATGAQTVANKVDVAVRRHIRTQILQDGMDMTERILDQAGVELVEVSSHGGSRPSHAKWEGRVYSRHGEQVIDGVRYRDFKTACNWGDVADGIGGANCRHSYSAYFPGMARTYEPNPPHPSGMENAEVYELTQKQRAGEREIRATKRELAGTEMLYEKSKSIGDLGEVARLKMRLQAQQKRMRDLVAENPKVLQRSPRREWAGDMPKVDAPKPCGRKVDELLEGKAAKAAMAKAGVSKAAVKRAMGEEMEQRGGKLKDFPALTAREQRRVFETAVPSATPVKSGRRQFRKIGGEHTASQDLAAVNPSYATMELRWTRNCQRCVPAYEMRRRGYDVVVKPRLVDESGKLVGAKGDPVYAGWASIFENARFEPCNGTGRARCDTLMRRWGDGARAEVYVNWTKGNAHVFVAENRNGKVVYIDPQNGVEDASGYFKKAKRNCTMIARIDNLNPSKLIDGCCTSRKGAEQ